MPRPYPQAWTSVQMLCGNEFAASANDWGGDLELPSAGRESNLRLPHVAFGPLQLKAVNWVPVAKGWVVTHDLLKGGASQNPNMSSAQICRTVQTPEGRELEPRGWSWVVAQTFKARPKGTALYTSTSQIVVALASCESASLSAPKEYTNTSWPRWRDSKPKTRAHHVS